MPCFCRAFCTVHYQMFIQEGLTTLEENVMRKMLLTTGAAIALMISPAMAQDAQEPAQAPETLTAPELIPVPPVGHLAAENAIDKPKFIGQQEINELLASSLIGTTVYSPTDETLGDINDLVFNEEDGRIQAVIVGVGGFLGIGQKNVAVSFDAIMETTDADGNVRLVLDATAEELDAAPVFMTLVEIRRQEELDRMEQMDPGLAPAPAPAPM
jgi:sporulation protein YlmC with PRC-barrel domain